MDSTLNATPFFPMHANAPLQGWSGRAFLVQHIMYVPAAPADLAAVLVAQLRPLRI